LRFTVASEQTLSTVGSADTLPTRPAVGSRSHATNRPTYRAGAGLPGNLTPHCLRHSYISHLIEDGVDPTFVQRQAGHSWASTTAGYTTVGADHANRMLRAAVERAFVAAPQGGSR
jgi:integrase/recombinase XerC